MSFGSALMNKSAKAAGKNKFPRQGNVYRVQFDPAIGSEIRKTRPAVVISNNAMNQFAKTVLVMPVTSGRHEYYLRIPVSPPEGGLAKPSVVATEQLRAVDKTRVGRRLGKLDRLTMQAIIQAVQLHVALR